MNFAQAVKNSDSGKTQLISTGQAGYIIKSASGQLLGIDLYLSDCVERLEGHMGYKRLLPKIIDASELEFDVIIATHPHLDHFDADSIPELMSNGHTHLFASVECENEIKRLEMTDEKVTYVKPGASYDEGDFHIDFINCDHGTGAPDAVGVIITVDGKRILEVGDTCLRLDRKEEYLSKGRLDVLIAPINGAYGNMDEEDCAKLSHALKPAVTIPCHYGMFASHGGNPGRFFDIMREKYPKQKFHLMAQGEIFTLKEKNMEREFEGKKLLILGGNPETIPLVEVAESMGIKTIVTSSIKDEPAKKVAWKSCDVDGMDVPGLITLAQQEQVDGVLVGVADILVPAYCKVCDALNFPCYATQAIVDVFSFKDVFKATCERYGIHGIPEYYLDASMRQEDIDKIKFPVMVKPVDRGSGEGMTVCYSEEELRPAVKKALDSSHNKRFIVEKYMQCEDMGMYYTFKDGYCSASCIYDRYTTDEQPGLSRVCLGGTYPSKHISEYFERMHDNAVRLFQNIGLKNGVLMLSGFYENGEFYVYDTGLRLQGEAPHLLMKEIHGFDQREMLIRFALTGSEGDLNLKEADDPYFRSKSAATLWFLLKQGKIARIEGLDEWKNDPCVINNIQRLYVGDEVPEAHVGTEKQVLTRMYLVCDTKQELADKLKYYMEKVKVYDEAGNNMLLKGFDIDKALELK
ncbi:MAG: MBL fold metallo-hydrolase [Rikenellaceae bacterium]|nr:MBL fold metallo-hydrolase [Rikenellaceae bacterium]